MAIRAGAFWMVRRVLREKWSLADAIIYASALAHHAELVTSDRALSGLPGVTLL